MGFLDKFWKKKAGEAAPFCSVVVVAAGQASRMEGIDKILCPMGGEAIVLRSVAPFQACGLVDEIVIVTREDLMAPVGTLCSQKGYDKVKRLVRGGASRPESVMAGLEACDPAADLIAIHDGARPFVTEEIIEETIRAARKHHAAAPAIPVKDTIKRAVHGVVTETPDRAELFAVQTPQIFDAALIKGAVGKALQEGAPVTDDCSAVERIGFSVVLTQGSEENIKITTPRDLIHGEAILAERMGK